MVRIFFKNKLFIIEKYKKAEERFIELDDDLDGMEKKLSGFSKNKEIILNGIKKIQNRKIDVIVNPFSSDVREIKEKLSENIDEDLILENKKSNDFQFSHSSQSQSQSQISEKQDTERKNILFLLDGENNL